MHKNSPRTLIAKFAVVDRLLAEVLEALCLASIEGTISNLTWFAQALLSRLRSRHPIAQINSQSPAFVAELPFFTFWFASS